MSLLTPTPTLQADMSRTVEKGYQEFLAGTAQVVALRLASTMFLLHYDAMTMSDTKLVYRDGTMYR